MNLQQAATRYMDFFAQFSAQDATRMTEIFSSEAHFKDPFNDVYGIEAISRIFTHMHHPCPQARFHILDHALNAHWLFIYWQFDCKSGMQPILGVSRVRFDAEGRALEHIDHWDTGEQLFARLPFIGGVFRWVLRRLGAD